VRPIANGIDLPRWKHVSPIERDNVVALQPVRPRIYSYLGPTGDPRNQSSLEVLQLCRPVRLDRHRSLPAGIREPHRLARQRRFIEEFTGNQIVIKKGVWGNQGLILSP
jgi:hypothetical protein